MSSSSGIPIFLFTDIEGSTRLWEEYPEIMREALACHDGILRETIEQNGGAIFKTVGDAFCAVFTAPLAAALAAFEIQTSLAGQDWKELRALKVRAALHTGEAEERGGDYFGPPLNRIARLLAVGYGGQVLISEAMHALLKDVLPPEMHLLDLGRHRLKDLNQPEQVYQLRCDGLPDDFPPLRSLSALRHNLPVQVTSFIGRQQEIRQVKQHLATTSLLTLTGPGGVGKTRLALQVAAEAAENFPAGVWLAEIAPLTEGDSIPLTVAQALGVREEPGKTVLQTLLDWLPEKRLLLILDNCEHLIPACAAFANQVIRSCPHVKLIISSRESLGIQGETIYGVPSFAIPGPKQVLSPEVLSGYDTVRLFVERATAVAPTFAVTAGNSSAVAQVCRRLDGIPLAVELAAARVRAMPVEQIATRLDDRFRFLTGGSRTALPRQQTLRALVDWSYDLLTDGEKTLLARLSVFAGGWTLAAAEQVCAGGDVEEWEILDLLTGLVGKSLVIYEEDEGTVRYRLLESIRQYARDRLTDSGASEATSARHRQWCLRLAEEAQVGLAGPEQAEWLARLEAEYDNLRAALSAYAGETDAENSGDAGLRLAAALFRFWEMRGYLGEAQEWLTVLLARTNSLRSASRAKALTSAGSIAWRRGDYPAARQFYEQSKEYYLATSDRAGLAGAVSGLANVVWYQGDHAAAEPLYEEALRYSRQTEDPARIAVSLNNLGLVANANQDWDKAARLFDECLVLRRERGDRRGIATALGNLGSTFAGAGRLEDAARLNDESLLIRRELGDRLGISYALQEKGRIARERQDWSTAHACFIESLLLKQELEEKWGVCSLLETLADLAVRRHDWKQGARLYGAAAVFWKQIGVGSGEKEQLAEQTTNLTKIRQSLSEADFRESQGAGRAMTVEQAIACAQRSK